MLSNLPTDGSPQPCTRGRGVDTVPMTLDEMRSEMGSAPKAKQRLSTSAMRAQSGTETMVRVRLRARRLKARVQAPRPTRGRIGLHHTVIHLRSGDRGVGAAGPQAEAESQGTCRDGMRITADGWITG
jgi:hypothetical protein